MRALKRLVAAALCAAAFAAHADFRGEVVGVLDGDTVDVLVDRATVRVRLAQIDAPEKAQPFGTRARQGLAALVFRQTVFVRERSADRYGRRIGTIELDGRNINLVMVEQGLAWVYRQYSHDAGLLQAESEAKAKRLGLWADAAPTPPWEWRKAKRGGEG